MAAPVSTYCSVLGKNYLADGELEQLVQKYQAARSERQTASRVSVLLFGTGASSVFYNIGCALSCCAASFCCQMSSIQREMLADDLAGEIEVIVSKRLPISLPENAHAIVIEPSIAHLESQVCDTST